MMAESPSAIGTASCGNERSNERKPSIRGLRLAPRGAAGTAATPRAPLCFVVDADGSIRHFLSLVLHGAGIDTEEFADGRAFRAAVARRAPTSSSSISRWNPPTRSNAWSRSARRAIGGYVQLMSSRGSAVLEHVKSIGEQHRLQMLPPLKKPFETGAVLRILQRPQARPSAGAWPARIDLDEALRNDWIEFWYQPQDRSAQETAGRRRGLRARAPSAKRRAHAERVHARRHAKRA